MLNQHLVLSFDPQNSPDCPKLDIVFNTPLARKLWLGIRQGHLINQYFEENCLRAGEEIQSLINKEKELTPGRLQGILSGSSERRILAADKLLCDDLIPYLTGEKEFTFEICQK